MFVVEERDSLTSCLLESSITLPPRLGKGFPRTLVLVSPRLLRCRPAISANEPRFGTLASYTISTDYEFASRQFLVGNDFLYI